MPHYQTERTNLPQIWGTLAEMEHFLTGFYKYIIQFEVLHFSVFSRQEIRSTEH